MGRPQQTEGELKVWKALVVWSDNETILTDISRFFNMGNKKRAYQASWIRNIMASREVWEFYGRPPKERENAKDKNPKWEVRMFGSIDPNYCMLFFLRQFYSLGRSTQTIIYLYFHRQF